MRVVDLTFAPWRTHPGWDATDDMVRRAYPEFMNHDATAGRCFPLMYDMYPRWQQLALDGDRPVGFFNSVPLPFDGVDADLPPEGWDWAIDLATRSTVVEPKVACAIQIVVDPALHGHGYARHLVSQMKANAAALGCDRLYVPIRPTRKSEFPLEPMEEYARRTRADGQPFDPWLRVHKSLGARLLHPCPRAMVIEGSREQWRRWSGASLESDGEHIVAGALAPVTVRGDRVTYIEPNLWLRHEA